MKAMTAATLRSLLGAATTTICLSPLSACSTSDFAGSSGKSASDEGASPSGDQTVAGDTASSGATGGAGDEGQTGQEQTDPAAPTLGKNGEAVLPSGGDVDGDPTATIRARCGALTFDDALKTPGFAGLSLETAIPVRTIEDFPSIINGQTAFKLEADIDLTGKAGLEIANGSTVIFGQGHTISNLSGANGLIQVVNGSFLLSDLTLKDFSLEGGGEVGAVANIFNGSCFFVKNLAIENAVIAAGSAGLLTGGVNTSGTITNLSVKSSSVTGGTAGKLFGTGNDLFNVEADELDVTLNGSTDGPVLGSGNSLGSLTVK